MILLLLLLLLLSLRFDSIPVQCSVPSLSLFLSFFTVFYNYFFLDLPYSPSKSLSSISWRFIISCLFLSGVLVSHLICLLRFLSHDSVCLFLVRHPPVDLWTSDQLVADTSSRQNTTLTTERHSCPRWNSNPQSQQASDPQTYTLDRAATATCWPVSVSLLFIYLCLYFLFCLPNYFFFIFILTLWAWSWTFTV